MRGAEERGPPATRGSAVAAPGPALLAVLEVAATALEERPLLRRGLEALADHIAVDAAEVRTEERGTLRVRHAVGAVIRGEILGDEELRARVLAGGETVVLPGAMATTVVAPLCGRDRVLGTLLVERAAAGFGDEETRILEEAGRHLGQALDRVRVFRSAVVDAERQKRLAAERGAALEEKERELANTRWLAALGQLAAGVAHDLNNALNPIVAFADLIRAEADRPERVRLYADRIRTAARDGANTVQRIQNFTRRRRMAATVELVPLSTTALEALDLARTTWADRTEGPIDVSVSIPPDLVARGNAAELREVILNLISNAVDAMPRGGTLRIVGSASGGEVRLAVQDTGTGMPEEVRRRAFEPFFTTKGMHGTGLGLSEVYGIVRRQGGEVELESWPGVGTTVLLHLPAAEPGAEPQPTPPRRNAASTLPRRILLVDDNLLSVEATAAALRTAGHQVETAATAEEALERFAPGAFDLVLTDVGLPGQTGWELIDRIHAADPEVDLGLITGWALDREDEKVSKRPIDHIFLKPVDPEEMIAEIGKATGN